MEQQQLPSTRAQTPQTRLTPKTPAPTNNELFDAASRGDIRTIGQLISRGVNVIQEMQRKKQRCTWLLQKENILQ